MKQDGGGGSSFPQGEVNASAFLPTGHSVAGDQKGRVGLFSPQLKGESPRILKVFTNTRWIDVLNEDEDDWRNATRRVKIFVPITALLPWVDVGGTESEMVRDLGPIAKKCNVFRSNVAPHPKTKAYGAEDEDEEPEPQLTPIDYIDQFFNDANEASTSTPLCTSRGENTALKVQSIAVFNKRLTDLEIEAMMLADPGLQG